MSVKVEPYVAPSVLAGTFALLGGVVFHATLPPDTSLYLHGASWFYPSPLGRAVGAAFGYKGLAFLTALAASFLPYIVSRIARHGGRDERVAAWGVICAPACWYLFAVSIDAIAATALVLAILSTRKGMSAVLLISASLLHLALIPSALAIAGVKHLRGVGAAFAVALCGALAFAYMVYTPYGLLVSRHVNLGTFLWTGAATFGVGIAPTIAALLSKRVVQIDSLFATGFFLSVIGGAEAAIQQHFQPRYCLPGALVLAAAIAPEKLSVYVYENGARIARVALPISSPLAGMTTSTERG